MQDYQGSVKVLGKEISKWDHSIYNEIAVLFEFHYLCTAFSAVDNLEYFSSFYLKERRQDIKRLLEQVELKEGFSKKPVSSYSKSMKQRVSLARALASSPLSTRPMGESSH